MSIDEDVPNLTPNQILALVVLMAEARELTNNELKDLAGFALTGDDNKKLVERGLVETDKSHRPFSHHLTDKGWRIVRRLPDTEPPKKGGSASRSLFTLLANLNRSLEWRQISLGEFFKQESAPIAAEAPQTPPPIGRTTTMADVEQEIRSAYRKLSKKPGEWVGLADLRDQLTDLDRETIDEALRGMIHQPGVRIIPTANTKALAPRDRLAAVRIGDEDNHTLAIGPA